MQTRKTTFLPNVRRCKDNIKKFFVSTTLYQIWQHFKEDILNGYQHYARIIECYGEDSHIYKTSGGTGDVYVAGLYFKEFLCVHQVQRKPIFTVIHESGRAVAELFDIENIEVISYKNRRSMVHFGIFMQFRRIHFSVIHHGPNSLYTSINVKIETVHDMCSFDVLKYSIYNGIEPSGQPNFNFDSNYINDIFKRYSLNKGKTVILVPYSVSMMPLVLTFWEHLAQLLQASGYTVCTNSKGDAEPPIMGTHAINVPIPYTVPFWNDAGFVVGVRTGIFDVTEKARVKRVIFYTEVKGLPRGQGGHNKKFYPHFSFNKWFERNDALEIEFQSEYMSRYIDEILDYFKEK